MDDQRRARTGADKPTLTEMSHQAEVAWTVVREDGWKQRKAGTFRELALDFRAGLAVATAHALPPRGFSTALPPVVRLTIRGRDKRTRFVLAFHGIGDIELSARQLLSRRRFWRAFAHRFGWPPRVPWGRGADDRWHELVTAWVDGTEGERVEVDP